jgi:ribosomal protein S11
VRLYFAPLLWLIMGVVVLAAHAYTLSSRYRARVSSDRLAEVQKANGQRFMTVAVLGVGVFAYAAIRTLIGGVDTWRLWFLAAAAQFGIVALRRAAGVKPEICAKPGRSRSW